MALATNCELQVTASTRFKVHLDAHGVRYSDYGTRFARDWHQIFFLAGT